VLATWDIRSGNWYIACDRTNLLAEAWEMRVQSTRFMLLATRLPTLYWLLGSSVQKQARRDGERSASPACKPRRVGVQSEVVTSLLMLNNTVLTRWRNFLYGSYFHLSHAVEGWLLACALLSLDSLDQTTRDLLAAPNPGRPWQKLVRAYRRKCPLATATHHPQAAGETARMHEKRSLTPRPLGKNGSNLAAVSLDRAT
jgi:hypothetical protein